MLLCMPQDDERLTTSQAAACFGVSRETFRRWVRAGEIEPLALPVRPMRFARSDVILLMARKRDAA
jgi:excisionase family DNA binding protein